MPSVYIENDHFQLRNRSDSLIDAAVYGLTAEEIAAIELPAAGGNLNERGSAKFQEGK